MVLWLKSVQIVGSAFNGCLDLEAASGGQAQKALAKPFMLLMDKENTTTKKKRFNLKFLANLEHPQWDDVATVVYLVEVVPKVCPTCFLPY